MILIDNQASGASLSKYTYTYDVLARRTDRAQSGSAINSTGTDAFSYNSRSEVVESESSVETATEWNPTYSYDKIGNRKTAAGVSTASYTTHELNQYSAISAASGVNPAHDLDGNLTGDGGNWTYTWNNDEVRQHEDGAPQACPKGCGERVPSGRFTQQNRLVSATDGTNTINFTYDYQGRLVKKDDGTNIEVYVYDGWNRIATFEVSPSAGSGQTFTLLSANVWGLDLSGSFQGAGGVGGLLKEGSLYPIYDANGNIMRKLNDKGAVVMSVYYDPFGNIISGTLTGEYGFSTKPLMDNLNWYYYGFRYYDPVTGRWPSRDPLGEAGSELSSKNYLTVAFEGKTRAEIHSLQAEIINLSNWIIGMIQSRGIGSIDDYYDAIDGIEIVRIDLDYLAFLKRLVAPSGVRSELLSEGPSLYAFVGNNSINAIDLLGQAQHGNNNKRQTRPSSEGNATGSERTNAEQKADRDRKSRASGDTKESPQERKERREKQKEQKKQEQAEAKEQQEIADKAKEAGERNPGSTGQMGPTNAEKAAAGVAAGVVTYIIVKKCIGGVLVLVPEPITTGIGVGLLATP